MSLPLCRASSKMSIMPSVATRRSDTKVLLNLKRNTPGRSPFERPQACPPQGVHSTVTEIFYRTTSDELPGLGSICTAPLVRNPTCGTQDLERSIDVILSATSMVTKLDCQASRS